MFSNVFLRFCHLGPWSWRGCLFLGWPIPRDSKQHPGKHIFALQTMQSRVHILNYLTSTILQASVSSSLNHSGSSTQQLGTQDPPTLFRLFKAKFTPCTCPTPFAWENPNKGFGPCSFPSSPVSWWALVLLPEALHGLVWVLIVGTCEYKYLSSCQSFPCLLSYYKWLKQILVHI